MISVEAKRRAALALLKWKGKKMKRNEWTVQYTGAKLCDAAKAKLDFHEGRVKFWSDSKDKVMAEIRAEGMEINESIADELRAQGSYTTSNAGYGPTVTIRHDLLARMQEAHGKVQSHEGLISQYNAWAQMMTAHPEAVFQLQHDDWMFFFGR